MNCQTCDYSLMNLTGGKCPECGEVFDIRSYHFVQGSVAFACPHCDHQHAGQGEHYLPADDDKAVCRACGEHMPLASIRVVPLKDDAEAQPLRQTPWERTARTTQMLKGLWLTCLMSLFQPSSLGELIGMRPRAWWAIFFPTFVCILVSGLLSLLVWGVMLMLWVLTQVISDTAIAENLSNLLPVIWLKCLYISISPFPLCLHLLLTIPVTHIMLNLTGKTQSGLSRTASAIAYGHGPAILCLLPVLGLPVAFIWILTSTICIVIAAQKVSFFRAAAACLVVPVILIGTPILFALYKLVSSFL
jgi:predicted RNA-binding Zn-ribbon protein involved in translation (DUF1610 family)